MPRLSHLFSPAFSPKNPVLWCWATVQHLDLSLTSRAGFACPITALLFDMLETPAVTRYTRQEVALQTKNGAVLGLHACHKEDLLQ